MKKAGTDATAVYTSEDGTVYDSTDGWRIESYGTDTVLAREVGGTLDAEIAPRRWLGVHLALSPTLRALSSSRFV